MLCPFCHDDRTGHAGSTRVADSRHYWDASARRYFTERRRVCKVCDAVFHTVERSPTVKPKERKNEVS